jgi:hypothetical protein
LLPFYVGRRGCLEAVSYQVGPVMNSRLPLENADTVSLVCALLVRFPELASIRSMPAEGSVRLTFALRTRLDKRGQAALADAIDDHVQGYLLFAKDEARALRIECEGDRSTTFVHVTRDTDTFSKDELELLVSVLRERYPEALVHNPLPEDHLDADAAAQDEAALYAIEALRDPAQSKSLVGFREEARVLVYFLKAQRKAKASPRR